LDVFGGSWFLYYLFAPETTDLTFPESSKNYIETQNSINLTLISASETAAVGHATATAEAEQGQ
jgi:hypothetical protein